MPVLRWALKEVLLETHRKQTHKKLLFWVEEHKTPTNPKKTGVVCCYVMPGNLSTLRIPRGSLGYIWEKFLLLQVNFGRHLQELQRTHLIL